MPAPILVKVATAGNCCNVEITICGGKSVKHLR